jgi:hypothetical protein
LQLLADELRRLGGKDLVLSSNCTLMASNPSDPGVCAYFSLRGKFYAIPCDRWDRIEHNVQSIILTIEAMRGMERWGAKNMIEAMFTGFKALPAPELKGWRTVLGVRNTDSIEIVKDAYRCLAEKHHPDRGGSNEMMAEINDAWKKAQAFFMGEG